MPRSTRIRDGDGPSDGSDQKPDWRARWKGWAVEQLPSTASRAARVQVRAAVERALRSFPADADETEIRDVVMSLVDETRQRLEADAECEARKLAKKVLVALAPLFLRGALNRLKSRGSVAMLSRPGYSSARLRQRLVHRLQRDLTGEETHDEVQAVVDAWVEARLAEQPPAPAVPKTVLVAGGATAVAVGVVVGQHPAARAAATRAVQKGRELARKGRVILSEVLSTLLTPPPAPPAPPAQPSR